MRAWVVLLVISCGRVGFDARDDVALDAMPCTSGATLAPVAAINASPVLPDDACNAQNVLVLDGMVGGLDRSEPSCGSAWDAHGSCGCIAADLGAVYALSQVTIHAAPVATGCTSPCSGSGCNTGDIFSLLSGVAPGDYTYVTDINTGSATPITAYPVTQALSARYIVVCRQSYSSIRDDFAIDAIEATCQ